MHTTEATYSSALRAASDALTIIAIHGDDSDAAYDAVCRYSDVFDAAYDNMTDKQRNILTHLLTF